MCTCISKLTATQSKVIFAPHSFAWRSMKNHLVRKCGTVRKPLLRADHHSLTETVALHNHQTLKLDFFATELLHIRLRSTFTHIYTSKVDV